MKIIQNFIFLKKEYTDFCRWVPHILLKNGHNPKNNFLRFSWKNTIFFEKMPWSKNIQHLICNEMGYTDCFKRKVSENTKFREKNWDTILAQNVSLKPGLHLHANGTWTDACGRERSRMYGTFVHCLAFTEAANRPFINVLYENFLWCTDRQQHSAVHRTSNIKHLHRFRMPCSRSVCVPM